MSDPSILREMARLQAERDHHAQTAAELKARLITLYPLLHWDVTPDEHARAMRVRASVTVNSQLLTCAMLVVYEERLPDAYIAHLMASKIADELLAWQPARVEWVTP